ncbi:MAG: hypothetical protein JRI23_35490, partial [Deltaproteobacteria bacterium]|nr:hypothetical protein [Deltaproteobacteria bacterium]MBW2537634.1 hypothetical protein [Deltaproteobacteria bacterium]
MKQELSARTKPAPRRPAIEIEVFWKQTPLGAHQLTPPCAFWLGESKEGEPPCDVPMDEEVLGARRVPLIRADRRGRVELCLLPGAEGSVGLPRTEARPLAEVVGGLEMHDLVEPVGARAVVLPLGAVARLRIGDLSFRLTLAEPAPRIARRRLGRAAWVLAGCCAVSLAAHSGLGCAAYLSHDPYASDELTEDQRYLLQYYMDQIEERRMEEAQREAEQEEIPVHQADNREGGAGTRARGEEGTMGGNRYGVRGPSSALPTDAQRSVAMRDAAEFGMIGL